MDLLLGNVESLGSLTRAEIVEQYMCTETVGDLKLGGRVEWADSGFQNLLQSSQELELQLEVNVGLEDFYASLELLRLLSVCRDDTVGKGSLKM